MEAFFRERGRRGKVEMEIITPEPQPMPVAGPVLGEAVKGILSARGIGYRANTPVSAVNAAEKTLVLKDGGRAGFDLLVAVPPHRPPAVVRDSGLAGETGWVPVDRWTLETKQEGSLRDRRRHDDHSCQREAASQGGRLRARRG